LAAATAAHKAALAEKAGEIEKLTKELKEKQPHRPCEAFKREAVCNLPPRPLAGLKPQRRQPH
jgi:hypothetical protein